MPHVLQASNDLGTEMQFRVEGLKCLACCARVKQHVMTIKGVESCQVDFEKAMVTVRGEGVREEAIIASLDSLGYRATPMRSSAASKAGADEAFQEQEL